MKIKLIKKILRKNFLTLLFLGFALAAFYPSAFSALKPYLLRQNRSEMDFGVYDKDSLGEIILRQNGEEIKIIKDGQIWKAGGKNASQAKIDQFFANLQSARIEGPVSRNRENHSLFEVAASPSAKLLTLSGRTGRKSYYLGKAGPQAGSFYLRSDASDNVYLAYSYLDSELSLNSIDWQEKTVVKLSYPDIKSVEAGGLKKFTLSKTDDNKWDLEFNASSRRVEDASVSASLSNLAFLEGYDIVGKEADKNEFASGFKQSITVKDKNNLILTRLELYLKDGDYWIKSEGREEIYKVYSHKISDLLNLPDRLTL